MSQLLEQEVHRNSAMGQALAPSLSSGELLGDGPANDLMMARLLRPDAGRGFILDGYPATEGQAQVLDQWLADHNLPKPTIVILQVPEEVSRARMMRRRRADDKPDNIDRRLKEYREVGRLVEQRYGTARTVRVDGTGAPPQVALLIAKGIDDLPSTQGLKQRTPEGAGLKHREPEQPAPEQKQ
jgi:adenylate kinase